MNDDGSVAAEFDSIEAVLESFPDTKKSGSLRSSLSILLNVDRNKSAKHGGARFALKSKGPPYAPCNPRKKGTFDDPPASAPIKHNSEAVVKRGWQRLGRRK